jgi:hypothetical protein
MKKILAFFFIPFFYATMFVSCTNAEQSNAEATADVSLTASEKQAIEKEIAVIAKLFFQNVERLDIDGCMTVFQDTSVFLSINPDGTSGDYRNLKKINGEGFSQMSSFKSTLNKESIMVLSTSQVLYTFFATQEFTLKTGEKMRMDHVAGTMLFVKANNSWKATFYQESGAHPVIIETK